MRSCKELKRMARGSLLGRYGAAVGGFFIVSLIVSLIGEPFSNMVTDYAKTMSTPGFQFVGVPYSFITGIVGTLIIALVSTILIAGRSKLLLNIARDEDIRIKLIFSQFSNRPDRYIVATLLMTLAVIAIQLPGIGLMIGVDAFLSMSGSAEVISYIIIGVLYFVLICVSIWLSLRWSFFTYILIDDPNISAVKSLGKSYNLLKGHCGKLFILYISFIPIMLLSLLSFGITSLWLEPYMESTFIHFYLDVTGEIDYKINEAKRMEEEMGPMMSDEYV